MAAAAASAAVAARQRASLHLSQRHAPRCFKLTAFVVLTVPRYDVTACPTKVVPGMYGFVAQLNEGRYSKKRPTEFRVDQVVQPFDPVKFNFTKAFKREVLFAFEPATPGHEGSFEDAARCNASPNVVLINVRCGFEGVKEMRYQLLLSCRWRAMTRSGAVPAQWWAPAVWCIFLWTEMPHMCQPWPCCVEHSLCYTHIVLDSNAPSVRLHTPSA